MCCWFVTFKKARTRGPMRRADPPRPLISYNLPSCIAMQVYNFNVPTFGPGVVYDVDQKVCMLQWRLGGAGVGEGGVAREMRKIFAPARGGLRR